MQKTVWTTFCILLGVFNVIDYKLLVLISKMCSSMKITRHFIKINGFNGHLLITVIARLKRVIFLPNHHYFIFDILLQKFVFIQTSLYREFLPKSIFKQRLKIASPNANIDGLWKPRNNGLLWTVGMERNITRSWFYVAKLMRHY